MEQIKIKKGDHVRTKDGVIAKCIDIDIISEKYTFAEAIHQVPVSQYYYLVDKNYCYEKELQNIFRNDIKPSSNIIDLIEVGDYVLVEGETTFLEVEYADSCVGYMKEIYFDKETMEIGYWNEQIKSVKTKEQLSSIGYDVLNDNN